MKNIKLLALFAAFFFAANAVAQDIDKSVMFCDKDGNTIEDGATIIPTRISEQELMPGYTLINVYSDLYVKNLAALDKHIAVEMTVEQIDNGGVQICCFGNCVPLSNQGAKKSTTGTMKSGEITDLQTEWAPNNIAPNGVCKVTYQVFYYDKFGNNYFLKEGVNGPKVNVIYAYGVEDAGIEQMTGENQDVVTTEYFDLQGNKLNTPTMGVSIKKMTYANGKTKTNKVIIK